MLILGLNLYLEIKLSTQGGHRTYFLNRGPIGGGGNNAHQNMLSIKIRSSVDGWVGGNLTESQLRRAS